MITLKRFPEQINSRGELVKKFKKDYPGEVTESLVKDCEKCKAITPVSKGKEGPGRTTRFMYSREHMVIIIAYDVLWEMGIEKSERDQLLEGCSLKDIKELQRKIKDSSYLQFLDFLKKKGVKLDYERKALRDLLNFKIT